MADGKLPWWRKALQVAIGGLRAGLGRLIGIGGALLPGASSEEPVSFVPSLSLAPVPVSPVRPEASTTEEPTTEEIVPLKPAPEAISEPLPEPVAESEPSIEIAPEMVHPVEADFLEAVSLAEISSVEPEAMTESVEEPVAAEPELPQPEAEVTVIEPELEPVPEAVSEPLPEPVAESEPPIEIAPEMVHPVEADFLEAVPLAEISSVEPEAMTESVEEPVAAEPELPQPEAEVTVIEPELEPVPEAVSEPLPEPVAESEPPIEIAPEMVYPVEADFLEAVPLAEISSVGPEAMTESVEEPVAAEPELPQPEAEVTVIEPELEPVPEAVSEPLPEPVAESEPSIDIAPEMVHPVEADFLEAVPLAEISSVGPEAMTESVEEPVAELRELTPQAVVPADEFATAERECNLGPEIDPAPEEVAAVCQALEEELASIEPLALAAADPDPEPVMEPEENFEETEASAQVLAAPAFIAYFSVPSAPASEPDSAESGEREPAEEQLSGQEIAEPESTAGLAEPSTAQETVLEPEPELAPPEPSAPEAEDLEQTEIQPEAEAPEEATGKTDPESMTNPNEIAAPEQIEAAIHMIESGKEEPQAELDSIAAAALNAAAEVEILTELTPEAEAEAAPEQAADSGPQPEPESAPAVDESQPVAIEAEAVALSPEEISTEESGQTASAEPAEEPAIADSSSEPATEEPVPEMLSVEELPASEKTATSSNLLQMPNPPAEPAPASAAPQPHAKEMIKREMDDATPFGILVDLVYEGPMDLLLDLIRKQDIDIYDIPIAKITAQFLAYVEKLKATDVDAAGEFIYMASLLIHIKSKMLLPRAPSGPEDASEDPRRELVERLLEHERFKNAAQMLLEKQTLEAATWSNPSAKEFKDDEGAEAEIAADTTDLVRIFRTILERARTRPVFNVTEDQVTVGQMLQFLSRRLTMEDKPVSLSRLLSNTRSERALVCTFLALLELVRLQAVLLRQDRIFSEIYIKKHTAFETVISEALANARDDWQ